MAAGTNRAFSRAELIALMERAIEEHGDVIIKRPGRKDLVLVEVDRLRRLDTTAYLLASPKNRRRLLAALRHARAGRGHPMTIGEIRKRVGLGR